MRSRGRLVGVVLVLAVLLPLAGGQSTRIQAASVGNGLLALSYLPGQASLKTGSPNPAGRVSSSIWRVSPAGGTQILYNTTYMGTVIRKADPRELSIRAVAESRDGTHIAYAGADDGIWEMLAGGTHRTQVWLPGDPGMVTNYGLGFTSGGTILAWHACCEEHTVALLEQGKLVPVITGDDGIALVFQDWLPSGSGMLFEHPDSDPSFAALYTTGNTGYALHTYAPVRHIASAIWQARFSPDGHSLLLAYSSGPVSTQAHADTIAVLDLRTGRLRVLLHGLADNLGSPSWSPDGKQIAFVACPTTQVQRCAAHDIWIMDADGSHRHDITHGALGDVQGVTWTPGAMQPLPRFVTP